MSETSIAKRGFHVKTAESTDLLETIGRAFLAGFGRAAGAASVAEAERGLETVDPPFRGFAYEGAAMAYAVLDALGLGGGGGLARFLAGPADRHVYMAYVGAGWALARVPRRRWHRVHPGDPLLGWLLLDGYGFHQAYFHTHRYVHERYQRADFRWPFADAGDYPNRVIDQGIGRALWFVEGTDVERIAGLIERFPARRRADLWSGAGLAATYAGGADEPELRALWKLAGDHRPQVAQASAFAAEARVRADLVTAHTHLATEIFCGMAPREAAALTHTTRRDLPDHGPAPAYEVWRQRVAHQFATQGRC